MTSAKEGRKHDTDSTARSKTFVPEPERHDSLHAHGEFVCPQGRKLTAVPFGRRPWRWLLPKGARPSPSEPGAPLRVGAWRCHPEKSCLFAFTPAQEFRWAGWFSSDLA